MTHWRGVLPRNSHWNRFVCVIHRHESQEHRETGSSSVKTESFHLSVQDYVYQSLSQQVSVFVNFWHRNVVLPGGLVVVSDVRSSGGVDLTSDVWRLTSDSRQPDVSRFFFAGGSPFFWKKERKTWTPLGYNGHSTCLPYTLVRYTV
jgi:hypothetical protein